MKSNEELLRELYDYLDGFNYIHVEDIPKIDLYMDQVLTFMDDNLGNMKRYPDDKILTKTMINNYAKNDLIPSPVRKKYTQEHILLLVFIYFFKSVLNFNDIGTLLSSISEEAGEDSVPLSEVYSEIVSLMEDQMNTLKEDTKEKYLAAGETFKDAPDESRGQLELFAFICELAFDVYLKKGMIEHLIDDIRGDDPSSPKK